MVVNKGQKEIAELFAYTDLGCHSIFLRVCHQVVVGSRQDWSDELKCLYRLPCSVLASGMLVTFCSQDVNGCWRADTTVVVVNNYTWHVCDVQSNGFA